MAGAAVWLPGTIPAGAWGEWQQFMWDMHAQDGVALWTHVGGPEPSSSRAELVALVMALATENSLLAKTDSAVTKATFEALQAGRLQLAKRPWGLRMNGDLWKEVQRMCAERGPNT
eukprot:7008040-Alexandrium_andersonii.AAC.1